MKFFKRKKFKKPTYFYSKYSDVIGLYRKEYLALKEQLPFHSVELSDDFAMIKLSCPLKSFYTFKKFYHYGERLDFTYLKERNLFQAEPWYNEEAKGFNSEITKDGDSPLPVDFNPCSLCKNELSCMFSSTKAQFQPKQYDTLYFLDVIKENGFTESEAMYHHFLRTCDDEYGYYSEMEIATWKDVIVAFCFVLPIILLYLPFHFVWTFSDMIKEKKKKASKV